MHNKKVTKDEKKNTKTKDVNEHIPNYIKNLPWYYQDIDKNSKNNSKEQDYLRHHRQRRNDKTIDIDNNDQAKIGTGIKDEFEVIVENKETTIDGTIKRRKDEKDWDARKDRWYGYSGKEYEEVLKKWEKSREDLNNTTEECAYDTDEEIEMMKLGLTPKDLEQTIKGSSVRLREDKAAYLKDIYSSTTNYDPKSRLYKSDDLGSIDEHSNMFLRHLTGEGKELNDLNKFARENAKESGIRDELVDADKVNHVLVANPTKLEVLRKQKELDSLKLTEEQNRQEQRKLKRKAKLLKKKAKKPKGTPQSDSTKAQLMDMYG